MYVGLTWSSCLVYGDDIVIFGKTFSKQLLHIKYVPEQLLADQLLLLCAQMQIFLRSNPLLFPAMTYTQPSHYSARVWLTNSFVSPGCSPLSRTSSCYCCSVKGFTDIVCTLHNRVVNFNGLKIVLGLQYAAPYHQSQMISITHCWHAGYSYTWPFILSHLFCLLHTCTNITRNKVICMERSVHHLFQLSSEDCSCSYFILKALDFNPEVYKSLSW